MKWKLKRGDEAAPPPKDGLAEEGDVRDSSSDPAPSHDKEDYLATIPTNTTATDDEPGRVDPIRTISKVPGNPNYYEKNGLRTYGDGEDHDTEPPLDFKRFMIFTGMAFLWTGSQIPVYLFGGILPLIIADVGGSDRWIWMILGNFIPLACITPFVGALSDLFGRRNLALFFSLVLVIGNIVCATANTMNVFIGGQVLNGLGAGVLELTALAATGELAPTSKRGIYVGTVIITILPYSPSVLYAQLVAVHSSWRYIGLWIALWAFTGGLLIAFFYFPPPRVNASGLTRKEVLQRIDYVGGFLSTCGLVLFLAGLTWGGNQYLWTSAHTLVPLFIGAAMIIMFIVWEWKFVKFPMFPGRLKTNLRPFLTICIITFTSGANFFLVLLYWPQQYFYVYAKVGDPISAGLGSLPVGFGIIGGSIIVSMLVTVLKGKIRPVMIVGCIIMTTGCGAMAIADQKNLGGIYVAISFACVGVGAVIIPSQIIASIVCPDDLIATTTALTIGLRTVGGCIGFSVFYNLVRQRYIGYATNYVGLVTTNISLEHGNGNWFIGYQETYNIAYAISANLYNLLGTFPHIDNQQEINALIAAGQKSFSLAFPIVWYSSIAFGAAATLASFFLPDLSPFMDDHIAVVYH